MNADPEAVRDALIACAKAHDLVLRIPAPMVAFVAITDAMLKFELMCFVADVETSGRVKSDLHFEIFKRFKEAGFALSPPAAPTPTIAIAGLERLEAALAAKS
jgi:small-conductance mechanosensitive channel